VPQTCSGSVISPCCVRSPRGLIALLVGLALSVGVSLGAQAATTWTVCASGCDYSSIKAAIAAPTTLNGDTLAIGAGTYTEAGIRVTKSLTLQGENTVSTIVQAATTLGTTSNRVFFIPRGVTVTLQALTIRHGHAVEDYGDGHYGGGLYNEGTLTLTQSTISHNTAGHGNGGGLANFGTLTLTQSTVSHNTAGGGGGLWNNSPLTLIASTVSGNTAAGAGGGLQSFDGPVTLTASTVSGNTASSGGGLYSDFGTLTLTASTVNGNTASGEGGGLYSDFSTLTLTQSTVSHNTATYGGGLTNFNVMTLTQSTVSGNTASGGGGGLVNGGLLTLTASTISGNTAAGKGGGLYSGGPLTLTASLVAQNPDGGDCFIDGPWSRSQGYNLDSDGSCQLTAATDRPGVDPRLRPLQDNGGPTLTHALLPGSPALDAIPWGTNGCGTILISDQRWQARPQPLGGACDIGAYEVEVAGQALGGWVTGFTPHSVTCKNATTGQVVTLSEPTPPWDCEAAGLGVTPGDHVAMHGSGPVTKGATDVSGAVTGMAPTSGSCINLTTGQSVTFQHLVGATAGSCVAAGLVVHPGNRIQISVQGTAG
jgi:predicted outer membrane repeat protein